MSTPTDTPPGRRLALLLYSPMGCGGERRAGSPMPNGVSQWPVSPPSSNNLEDGDRGEAQCAIERDVPARREMAEHRLVLDRTLRATGSANRLREHGTTVRSVPWRGRADRTLRAHATRRDASAVDRSAVMGTTYLASTALARAADALDAVNEHATLSGSGLCRTCRVEGPCPSRTEAERTLRSSGMLPRRRPGFTRPELIGLRRVGTPWLKPDA
ncbi:hypothetical protein [Salinispora arenicola]|uniref:hypothetical protein n=1 Tax=Salinispora arenicola TaxID=168697 RepID=UPI0016BAF8A0|nr:hypothetical protein [Salinispora arenicola]NIL55674.1 hypothetical protein [Salinispora arenicola]NIL64047.1 hypothetical protein [Salinispora arenicola]